MLYYPENEIGGCGHGEPWPGCRFNRDQTPEGICDLAGNVHEWVMAPVTGVEMATRGGGFDSTGVDGRVSAEASGPSVSIGFRCVRQRAPCPPLRTASCRWSCSTRSEGVTSCSRIRWGQGEVSRLRDACVDQTACLPSDSPENISYLLHG